MNKELNAGLADSKVKGRIVELGGTVLGGTPAEFGKIISEATEKWARVIKVAGIKAVRAGRPGFQTHRFREPWGG